MWNHWHTNTYLTLIYNLINSSYACVFLFSFLMRHLQISVVWTQYLTIAPIWILLFKFMEFWKVWHFWMRTTERTKTKERTKERRKIHVKSNSLINLIFYFICEIWWGAKNSHEFEHQTKPLDIVANLCHANKEYGINWLVMVMKWLNFAWSVAHIHYISLSTRPTLLLSFWVCVWNFISFSNCMV